MPLSKGPNRGDVSHPSPEDGNASVSETLCSFVFLESQTMDKVQTATNPEKFFCSLILGSVFSSFVQGDLERKCWEVKK
jgi:hypothetical protein